MKPRLCVYIPAETDRKLGIAAGRNSVSKSAIVEAALESFLSPDRDDQRDAALIRRIEQLARQIEKQRRDHEIVAETVALFILYFLTLTPPLPEADQGSAKALGRDRMDYFLKELTGRVAEGRSRQCDGGPRIVRDQRPELERVAPIAPEHDAGNGTTSRRHESLCRTTNHQRRQ